MKHLRKLLALPFSLALVVALGACAGQPPAAPAAAPAETQPEAAEETMVEEEMAEEAMEQDIVAIASGDERFSTLVTALSAAGLVETLQGEGPFTVFAPTDDAFAALPEGTVEGLLEDIPALTDVLLYHVVAGNVMAADVVNLESASTVQGSTLPINVEDGKVMVGDAEVIITDIAASNGVIHVINAVLVPAAEEAMAEEEMDQSIVDIAVADERFGTLVAALTAADLVETLQGEGPFTVFAPTDDAFSALPEGTVEGLLADIPALTDVLLYHVVAGNVMAADVVNLDSADTVQGTALTISVEGDKVMINDATVVITDIQASNGVIHVIDTVLVPAAAEEMAEDSMEMEQDIVAIASGDKRFSTLVTALSAAGLVETLQGEGPFTVFAPTDDAFAALPEGTVEGLLENIPALTDVLLYHVVAGQVMAADVVNLDSADTVQGSAFDISVEDGRVMVGDAEVIITDIPASNGVIHVIDAVLVPAQS